MSGPDQLKQLTFKWMNGQTFMYILGVVFVGALFWANQTSVNEIVAQNKEGNRKLRDEILKPFMEGEDKRLGELKSYFWDKMIEIKKDHDFQLKELHQQYEDLKEVSDRNDERLKVYKELGMFKPN